MLDTLMTKFFIGQHAVITCNSIYGNGYTMIVKLEVQYDSQHESNAVIGL